MTARMTSGPGPIEPVPDPPPPARGLRALLAGRKLPRTTISFLVDEGDPVEVEMSAIPCMQYEALLAAHPPKEGQRTAWDPATFVPAALAVSSVPPELDEAFWTAYCEGATSRTVAELVDVFISLNSIGSVKRP